MNKGLLTSANALVCAGADTPGEKQGLPCKHAADCKLAHSISQAALATGLSRATLYELHKQGAIRFVKCGRRTLILHEELVAFLQALR